jgi:outer membrane protein assembly factor BamB
MNLPRLLVGLALAAASLGGDWPQLLGPTRNGVSPEKGLLDSWPKDGPPVVWQRDVGEGYAGPVVAGGRLVVFHRVGDEDVVDCLDAATGKPIWAYRYRTDYEDDFGKGNGPRSTPVIAGGKVYTLGAGGRLLCLDLKKGTRVWEKELNTTYRVKKGFFGVGYSPLVVGDLLLANVGGVGAGVVAFDKDTGKERWRATDQGASYSTPVAATVGGVRHVFFFTREGLVSLDPDGGKVRFTKRWRSRNNASVNAASPLVLGGEYLFLSASYDTGDVLLRVKKDGAEEVWRSREALSSHFGTPVPVGGQLYGFAGRQEAGAQLRCIDWKTGKVRWTEADFGCGTVLAAGNKLFVLSETGELVLVEAGGAKYAELARARVLGRALRAHLALAGGRLYARDNKKLVCWKVKK